MLDPMLGAFVETRDESEAERQLATLLENEAMPLIRKIVLRKLGTFAREDIDDVVSEATLLLLERLRALRADPESDPIARFEDYTAAVAFNVCSHQIRQKYPERSRLKNRLRYMLSTDGRFGLWDTPRDGLVCGLARWHGAAVTLQSRDKLHSLSAEPDRWSPASLRISSSRRPDPRPLLAEVFLIVDGPIEFDDLVNLIATMWRIGGTADASGTAALALVADPAPQRELLLDQRRFAERLWGEVTQLPHRQRTALLLNLRDDEGSGVLWVFPVTGVASIRSIAERLEIPVAELAELWNRLPLDDNTIAGRLGCTRQQVINLRLSARRRLRNRLGNLGAISLSMGNEREVRDE